MSSKLDVMTAFVNQYNSGDALGACRTYLADNFECHEPPELPQGGVHRGWNAPVLISEIYRNIWDVDFLDARFWDTGDGDVVVSRYLIKWTHKATKKSVTQPVVELNTIVSGKIVKMEVFHFNPTGLLATTRV